MLTAGSGGMADVYKGEWIDSSRSSEKVCESRDTYIMKNTYHTCYQLAVKWFRGIHLAEEEDLKEIERVE